MGYVIVSPFFPGTVLQYMENTKTLTVATNDGDYVFSHFYEESHPNYLTARGNRKPRLNSAGEVGEKLTLEFLVSSVGAENVFLPHFYDSPAGRMELWDALVRLEDRWVIVEVKSRSVDFLNNKQGRDWVWKKVKEISGQIHHNKGTWDELGEIALQSVSGETVTVNLSEENLIHLGILVINHLPPLGPKKYFVPGRNHEKTVPGMTTTLEDLRNLNQVAGGKRMWEYLVERVEQNYSVVGFEAVKALSTLTCR